MIERITRILLLLQFAAAAGIFMLATQTWHAGTGIALWYACGAVLLFRIMITANNFRIALRYRSETPAAHQITWQQACRLFAKEFIASMTSSSWTMAFYAFEKYSAENPKGLPVLLIHGYGCNSGYWHSMSKALAKANITHYAIDLEPVFGSIDDYAEAVHAAVEMVCTETNHNKIVIVAHSMGGLVARVYLRNHGISRIAAVVTLGTPHRGTSLANFGAGSNSSQMRWIGSAKDGKPSDWLAALEAAESETVRALFVSIYSYHDNIVSPQTSSVLPGAVNVGYRGIGHVALASTPEILQRVIHEILRVAANPARESEIIK